MPRARAEVVERDTGPLLRWSLGGGPIAAGTTSAEVAVTTRHGGSSDGPYRSLNLGLHVGDDPGRVIENRARAAALFGTSLDRLVFAEQVHGTRCQVVTAADAGRGTLNRLDEIPGTDALVTTELDLVLTVLVADCLPLVLFDAAAGVLGLVHAGWRGTAAGVAGTCLDVMIGMGASPGRVEAVLGPCIAPDRYQVDEPVARAIADRPRAGPAPARPGLAAPTESGAGDDDAPYLVPDGPGHWLLDLSLANRRILEQRGVAPGHITATGHATGGDEFFSHRAAAPCGRFAMMARRNP